MLAAFQPVYNAAFETIRIKELAGRFPRLKRPLRAIVDRIVDLMPIARQYYCHPSQEGSWSIKSLLPCVTDDPGYGALDGVEDGNAAMAAYVEALQPDVSSSRKEEIRRQLLAYCALDTLALVRLWEAFSGRAQRIG